MVIFSGVTDPYLPHSATAFNDELERVGSDSFSDSENLTSASLSAYDCDSEGEAGMNSIDSDSDSEVRGTRKPDLTNLKFQLDAAKAGEHYAFHLMDPKLTVLRSLE